VTIVTACLGPNDTAYPSRLRERLGGPCIYVRGAIDASAPSVAVVGARAASAIGMARAHALGRHLAGAGVHVVSGGALGIDGAAHRGALAGGGRTTVVLGCGVDIAYPRRHAGLFADIVATGGALVSAMAPGELPRRGSFPARNPIIAALAEIVVVVEAAARSGSSITARAAQAQGAIVAAYPGSPGCDALLAAGAALVEQPADVIDALAGRRRPARPRVRHPAPLALDPIGTAVHAAVAAGARSVDAIIAATGLPARSV
jgi:DNA processing protein